MMPRLQAWTRPFAFAALAAAVLLPATAGAQTGGYLSFNGGTQATSTTFDDNIGFTAFHEDADFNAGYGIGTGTVFDAGGGVRLASGLGFGVGVSRFEKTRSRGDRCTRAAPVLLQPAPVADR